MIRALRTLVALLVVTSLTGCAGGWRNGVPPQGLAEGTAAVAAPSKAAAASQATADGMTFKYTGAANTVHLAGEFNAWSTSTDPLVKGSDGAWTITKKLAPGRYAYKFVIDGGTWKDDPTAKESVDDGFGGKNSIAVVGAAPAAPAAAAPMAATPTATGDGATFRYSGAGNTVNLAGEFNAWSTSADAMTKGADGVWTITKKLAPGRYAYKFVVDGSNWKEDPAAKETVDDGFGGKNAIMVVGAGAGAAAPVAAAPVAAAPIAAGDGATFRYTGAGNTVNLAGEFNAWSTSADAMTKGADGVWTITKKLAPGRYAYKFVVDGSNWKEDPAAKETVDDGFGGKNAIMIVGAGAGAGAATPAAAAAAPAAARAVTGKAKAPVVTAAGVVFTYAGSARSVALCGSFNDWAPAADPMTQQADGTWTITKKLKAGNHSYKFLVDGAQWKTDEANKTSEDDGFGGKNSVVLVK